jgi:hypothetical protein
MSTQLRCSSGSHSPPGASRCATSGAQDFSPTMQHMTSPAGSRHSSDMSHGFSARHMALYSTNPGQTIPHSSIRFVVGPIVGPFVRDSGAAVVCSTERGTTDVDSSSGGPTVVASSLLSPGNAVVAETTGGDAVVSSGG